MQIDLTSILQLVGALAGIGLGGTGSWAAMAFAKKVGIQANSEAMKNFDAILMKSISAAGMILQDIIKEKGWDHPEVQNKFVAEGAAYAIARFKDTLADAGIDPATAAGQSAIKAAIQRALPAGIAAIASSPTTPPVPHEQKAGDVVVVPPAQVFLNQTLPEMKK